MPQVPVVRRIYKSVMPESSLIPLLYWGVFFGCLLMGTLFCFSLYGVCHSGQESHHCRYSVHYKGGGGLGRAFRLYYGMAHPAHFDYHRHLFTSVCQERRAFSGQCTRIYILMLTYSLYFF